MPIKDFLFNAHPVLIVCTMMYLGCNIAIGADCHMLKSHTFSVQISLLLTTDPSINYSQDLGKIPYQDLGKTIM